jgi:FAD:protein FMN transferase
VFRQSRMVMGTSVEITVSHPAAKQADQAMEAAFQEVERVDFLMSNYRPESEVSRITRSAGKQEVRVSAETLAVIERALFFSRLSGGAFDITIGPVFRLWNLREGKIPEQVLVQENLKRVDYRKIRVDSAHSSVFLAEPRMEIDLGAIAKGYAVDRACESLQRKGIENFLVNAGGDLKVRGEKEPGLPWVVGIRHPRLAPEFIAKLRPRNAAVATSGDYEKFFLKEGERYHHILNPLTGKPARECQAVTIMAPSAMDADALATAVFVLGPAKGLSLLAKIANAHGIIVNARGNVLVSPNWPEGVLIPP